MEVKLSEINVRVVPEAEYLGMVERLKELERFKSQTAEREEVVANNARESLCERLAARFSGNDPVNFVNPRVERFACTVERSLAELLAKAYPKAGTFELHQFVKHVPTGRTVRIDELQEGSALVSEPFSEEAAIGRAFGRRSGVRVRLVDLKALTA